MVKALSLLHKFLRPQGFFIVLLSRDKLLKFKFYAFKYTELIDDLIEAKTIEIKKENKRIRYWNNQNPDEAPKKSVPFYYAQMHLEATQEVQKAIQYMKRGNAKQKLKARLLELEISYIRKREKRKTINQINSKFGDGSHRGEFTLTEIANTFNVTKERVRQVEHQANRRMNHPQMKRILQGAIYA